MADHNRYSLTLFDAITGEPAPPAIRAPFPPLAGQLLRVHGQVWQVLQIQTDLTDADSDSPLDMTEDIAAPVMTKVAVAVAVAPAPPLPPLRAFTAEHPAEHIEQSAMLPQATGRGITGRLRTATSEVDAVTQARLPLPIALA